MAVTVTCSMEAIYIKVNTCDLSTDNKIMLVVIRTYGTTADALKVFNCDTIFIKWMYLKTVINHISLRWDIWVCAAPR